MAIDLAALRAKLAAKTAAVTGDTNNEEIKIVVELPVNSQTERPEVVSSSMAIDVTASDSVEDNKLVTAVPAASPTTGADRTVSIDHMDFLSKIQELETAILTQHPTMPVLLMKIHKQIAADPELVTVISEEEIGIIVNGLKIQTKTELVGTIAKQSKARDKKTKLDLSMF